MKSRPTGKRHSWALFLGLTLLAPELALSQQVTTQTKRASTSSATFRAYIKAAAQLYEELEYEAALNVLASARAQAGSEDELADAAIYEAIVLADLGRRRQALKVFAEALHLKPDAKLPVRVSPKVAKDFETIQGQFREEEEPPQASAASQPRPVTTDSTTRSSTDSTTASPTAVTTLSPPKPSATPLIEKSAPQQARLDTKPIQASANPQTRQAIKDTPVRPSVDSPTASLTATPALTSPAQTTIPLIEKPTPQQDRHSLKQVPLALVGTGIVTGSFGAYLSTRAQTEGAIVMYTAAAAALAGAAITHFLNTGD